MNDAKRILILGATSALAQEVAKLHAQSGDHITLVARNAERNALIAEDLKVRGALSVTTETADLANLSEHSVLADKVMGVNECYDTYYFFYGLLPDQPSCQGSCEATERALQTNFNSVASLLTLAANRLEAAGAGTLVVATSVAGDRGRQSNYVYGAAKGGLSIFLQGLRNRLARCGVNVLDVKPGFMDTPMTSDFEKGGPLWVGPDRVARDIHKAVLKHKSVLYSPWFWWPIMRIIKSIPEFIFKRLSL